MKIAALYARASSTRRGSNLLSSLSMRCQRSSGKAQSVKIRALSAIGLFVLCLINQEDKADADSVIMVQLILLTM